MYKTGISGSRILDIFILICLAVIALSSAFVAQGMFALTIVGTALVGGVVFSLLFLLNNQRLLHRAVRNLEYLTSQPEDFESDLNRRLDGLTRHLEQVKAEAFNGNKEDVTKLKILVQALEQELRITSDRVREIDDQFHQSIKEPEPPGKVVPLHQPPETFARAAKTRNKTPVQSHANATLNPEIKIDEAVRTIRQNNGSLAKILHDAVKSEALELHLQPIVDLHSHAPVYYETMLRLKGADDQYFDPLLVAKTARAENFAAAMDFLHLFDAVRMLRALDKINKKAGLLCPVTRSSLSDPASFEEMLSFLKANKSLAKWLIIGIEQTDWDNLDHTELQRVAEIVDHGYFLSLCGVMKLNFNASHLHAVGFRFAKVSADTLFSPSMDGGLRSDPIMFSAEMERCGIAVIASRIKREAEVLDLIDLELPLGQGDHFSSPRPVKAELLRPVSSDPGLSGFGLA